MRTLHSLDSGGAILYHILQKNMQAPPHREDRREDGNPAPTKWQRQSIPRAFRNAWAGLCAAVRTQRNMRIHLAAAAAAVGAGLFFGLNAAEWTVLAISCALVLALESMNTALESVVDLVSPQYTPLARRAKDCAAGAVLIASLSSLVVGGILFIPKILAWAGSFSK